MLEGYKGRVFYLDWVVAPKQLALGKTQGIDRRMYPLPSLVKCTYVLFLAYAVLQLYVIGKGARKPLIAGVRSLSQTLSTDGPG